MSNTNNNISSLGSPRIIIAGGGTGGHIFPAIAIANALKEKNPLVDILFVGAKGKMEMEKVPEAGYKIKGIDIAGYNRSSILKNISLPIKLVTSFYQVKNIINSFHPDAVIGVGGYSSFPVLKYAQVKGIPTFIHESNSFAGKSNILLGKKAVNVFVASDGMNKFFPENAIIKTGNPIRKNIAANITGRNVAIKIFNLKEDKTTLLVTGGSLGARSINQAIAESINTITKAGIQIIWQTGKGNAQQYDSLVKDNHQVWISDFIKDMSIAYAAADIVVSRAGAMAVAEICVVKKPVIFVPYPFASEDHQTANAKELVNKNAALMIVDKDVQEKLGTAIVKLAKDINEQETFIKNIADLGKTDADSIIAETVLNYINNK